MILSLNEKTQLHEPEPYFASRSRQDREQARTESLFPLPGWAMLQELDTSPKPGLVDREDNGAHSDMDYLCFRRSIEAVAPYFSTAMQCASGRSADVDLWQDVRHIGLSAEKAMFSATRGVNTHKGQIFVLMLLSAAAASVSSIGVPALQHGVRSMTRGMVEQELITGLSQERELSHGERLFLRFGLTGIRGEAESGFPVIFEYGLPVYAGMCSRGYSVNDASLQALLAIMSRAQDTTIVHRGGINALKYVQDMSAEVLYLGGVRTDAGMSYVRHMNKELISRGISPGGCADLLAGTLFVYEATRERISNGTD